MKIDKSGRDTLKSYFVRNAVPTVGNYQELIDAALNQRDDGISKPVGDALSVQADGDDASPKKLLNLYRSFNDAAPAWTLSLNPRDNAADPASAHAGLAFGNGAGRTALFLEQRSANVGIGTLNPARPLHVEGNEIHSGGGGAGFSFASRNAPAGVPLSALDASGKGDRWVWYAQDGSARLWSQADKVSVSAAGDLQVAGALTAQKGATLSGGLAVNGDLTVHSRIITLGLDGNGGGRLVLCNNANDNRIYLEAFNRTGDDSATEMLLTGINSSPVPQLTFVANNTGVTGTMSVGATTPPLPGVRLQVAGGAIQPAPSSSRGDASSGILFPPDIGGGGGDRAWIRYYSRGGESLTLEIGCSNDGDDHISLMPSGNVGIGTLTPQGKLDVAGSIMAGNSDIYFTNTGHNHSAYGNAAGFAALENAANYNALMILGRSTGQPNVLPNGGGRRVEVWDFMRVNGIFVNASDANAKRDITPLEYGLDAVRRLRPVSFNWNDVASPHKTIGLIAQEVRPVISEVVYDDAIDEKSRLSIAYTNLIPVLINAIQELAEQLDALRAAPSKA